MNVDEHDKIQVNVDNRIILFNTHLNFSHKFLLKWEM